jgi:hypothetical protein
VDLIREEGTQTYPHCKFPYSYIVDSILVTTSLASTASVAGRSNTVSFEKFPLLRAHACRSRHPGNVLSRDNAILRYFPGIRSVTLVDTSNKGETIRAKPCQFSVTSSLIFIILSSSMP